PLTSGATEPPRPSLLTVSPRDEGGARAARRRSRQERATQRSGAYLHCAASMPVRPEAAAELARVLTELPGNPSGAHAQARAARRVLDDARDVLAEVLGSAPRPGGSHPARAGAR